MKRYSLNMQAGVPIELDHPGRFFTLLESVAPVNVSLQRAGKQAELLESITAGFWADFEDEPFTRVRIISPGPQTVSFLVSMVRTGVSNMESGLPTIVAETGVNPVVAFSGQPGWVSGDPAGLAASAQVNAIFDLGPHWDRYGLVAVTVNPAGPSSGFSAVQASGADTPSNYDHRRAMAYAFQGSGQARMFAAFNTASAAGQVFLRPNGRFFTVNGTNADAANAMGANAKFTLAAYPHN